MRIGQMIKNCRDEHGLSIRAFAHLSGISPSYVSKLESDTQNKLSLTLPKIAQIAQALGMTADDLLATMDDTQIRLNPKPTQPRGNMLSPERLQIHLNTVPVYDPISCGTGKWVDEQPIDYLGVPDTMISKACHYFANPAYGDSMEPRILNGDYIVFEQTESIDPGCIGAFSLNGEYFCKRFKKLPDGSMWLFSENPRYDPIPIQRDDDFRVLGKYRMRMTEN